MEMPFLPIVSDFPFFLSAFLLLEKNAYAWVAGNDESSNRLERPRFNYTGDCVRFVSAESEIKNLVEFKTNDIEPAKLPLSFFHLFCRG